MDVANLSISIVSLEMIELQLLMALVMCPLNACKDRLHCSMEVILQEYIYVSLPIWCSIQFLILEAM